MRESHILIPNSYVIIKYNLKKHRKCHYGSSQALLTLGPDCYINFYILVCAQALSSWRHQLVNSQEPKATYNLHKVEQTAAFAVFTQIQTYFQKDREHMPGQLLSSHGHCEKTTLRTEIWPSNLLHLLCYSSTSVNLALQTAGLLLRRLEAIKTEAAQQNA